jgi:uncharacterized membrane protein YfcA
VEAIIAPAFFAIAFVFSMLGMGGSQLYIPMLFWLGMDFKTEAIPLGMLLNVVNSSSAAITYGLRGLIDWHIAIPFGLTMVVFAPLGALVNVQLPVSALVLFFAVFTAVAALLMLRGRTGKQGRPPVRARHGLALGLGGGSALGFVAGLIGRGGGSFVVPLLYMTGVEARTAAATSAFVVTCSGLSSFISHMLLEANPIWQTWILSVLAVLAGSQLGSRFMVSRLDARQVRHVFGIVLLCVSALLVARDVVGIF